MPGTTGPNLGLKYGYSSGDSGWGVDGYNPGFNLLDAIVHLEIISASLTAPPGSPSSGDRYIPDASATGAWSGHDGEIAIWLPSAWQFFTPKSGWRAHNVETDTFITFDGSSWADEPGPAPPVSEINDQVGTTYTIDTSDAGNKIVLTNGSGITLTVPSGLGTPFDCLIIQGGAGQVTFATDGTTIHNRSSYTKTAGQWATMSLIAVDTDVFVLSGDGA